MERLQGLADRLVADGEVPFAVVGFTDGQSQWLGSAGAVSTDAVFRISSMTKPLIAALTLRLVASGVLGLHEPVVRWLPELAGQRVLRRLDGPVDETVPAGRAVTVEDLLTMRMGFGFAFEVESCPVAELAAPLGMGPPIPSAVTLDPDAWIARFGELPLMDQPGTVWRYDLAYALLGVLLARAGGVALPDLLRREVLEPLEMRDTGFAVPAHAQGRLVEAAFDDGSWLEPPVFPHAGGGLVSTASDYLRFVAALLNGWADLAAVMVTDRLTAEQRGGASAQAFLDGGGWGYGVQVVGDRYGWGGGLGTLWYSRGGVGAVLMTQVLPPSPAVVSGFVDTLSG